MWMPKNVRPLFAMLLRAASGDLNCGLKLRNPVLEAGVTNLFDLVQHAKESIEASGIDGPRIRLGA